MNMRSAILATMALLSPGSAFGDVYRDNPAFDAQGLRRPGVTINDSAQRVDLDAINVQPFERLKEFTACVAGGSNVADQRVLCLKRFGDRLPIEFIDRQGDTIVKRVSVIEFGVLREDDNIGLPVMTVLMVDQMGNVLVGADRGRVWLRFRYQTIGSTPVSNNRGE